MQKCSKCGVEKPLSDFYFRKDINRHTTQCKKCLTSKQKERYVKNKEYYSNYNKVYRNVHPEYFKNYFKTNSSHKKFYDKNKDKLQERQRYYYQNHKEHVKDYNNRYRNNKIQTNNVYRYSVVVSKLLRSVFNKKGKGNSNRLKELTGLNNEEFYKYLLQTFENNYGRCWDGIENIHIDHIKPLATAKSKEDINTLNWYTNLQLLTAEDNMKKSKHLDN